MYNEGKATNTLARPDDANVYIIEHMLTDAGQAAVKGQGEKWLTMQQTLFTPPSTWTPVGTNNSGSNVHGVGDADGGRPQLSCSDADGGDGQICTVTMTAAPPVVAALWFAPTAP